MAQTHLSSRDPIIRTAALLSDLNLNGNIFGGWILSQMDIAGGFVAARHARGPVATVAIEAMKFHRPINAGELVSCYAHVAKVGRTSLHVVIEVYTSRASAGEEQREVKVTEGTFIFVALDDEGRPRVVPPLEEATPA